jgi:cobalt-precorrin 5A hydrolase/precorrin-3B C17-methyltransferase
MMSPAIIVLGPGGLDLAHKIVTVLPDAEVHGLARRVDSAQVSFDDTGDHLRALFAAGTPVIGICAAGILIRLLAPSLTDKTSEPPVIAVAEDGSAVVPLLGGHHGANDLAQKIAAAFGAVAAVTTAGDVRFGVALDSPPAGWTLANPDDVKSFAGDLLGGQTVGAHQPLPPFLADADIPRDLGGTLRISATPHRIEGDAGHLVYHPASVAVGVGCERGTDPAELIALVNSTLEAGDIASEAIAGIYSLDLKADEPAVHAAAAALGVEVFRCRDPRGGDTPSYDSVRCRVSGSRLSWRIRGRGACRGRCCRRADGRETEICPGNLCNRGIARSDRREWRRAAPGQTAGCRHRSRQ